MPAHGAALWYGLPSAGLGGIHARWTDPTPLALRQEEPVQSSELNERSGFHVLDLP